MLQYDIDHGRRGHILPLGFLAALFCKAVCYKYNPINPLVIEYLVYTLVMLLHILYILQSPWILEV